MGSTAFEVSKFVIMGYRSRGNRQGSLCSLAWVLVNSWEVREGGPWPQETVWGQEWNSCHSLGHWGFPAHAGVVPLQRTVKVQHTEMLTHVGCITGRSRGNKDLMANLEDTAWAKSSRDFQAIMLPLRLPQWWWLAMDNEQTAWNSGALPSVLHVSPYGFTR